MGGLRVRNRESSASGRGEVVTHSYRFITLFSLDGFSFLEVLLSHVIVTRRRYHSGG